jgi:hypothetical protein
MRNPLNEKLGRNNPCWCGSGKKFKKCHLNKKEPVGITKYEAWEQTRKAFKKKECCASQALGEQCNGPIIGAHTISKSASLKMISKNGHVYAYKKDPAAIDRADGNLKPELIGINKASTFNGFCSFHDKNLFSPLEDRDFIGDQQQCFLAAYRNVCREWYAKRGALQMLDDMRAAAKGKGHYEGWRKFFDDFETGTLSGFKGMQEYKSEFDDALKAQRYEAVGSLVIQFSAIPSVMCSGGIYPEVGFDGRLLQNLADLSRSPNLICFSTIGNPAGGAFVLSWLKSRKVFCDSFTDSLYSIPDEMVSNAIIRMLFEYSENVHISPDWWDAMPPKQKDWLTEKLTNGLDPLKPRERNCLMDDGMVYADWRVTRKVFV